jgi:hypothetical protein
MWVFFIPSTTGLQVRSLPSKYSLLQNIQACASDAIHHAAVAARSVKHFPKSSVTRRTHWPDSIWWVICFNI